MTRSPDNAVELLAENERLSDEVARLKQVVDALGRFAGAFLDCYRDSDMRPEDECHDLYLAAVHAHSLALNAGGTPPPAAPPAPRTETHDP